MKTYEVVKKDNFYYYYGSPVGLELQEKQKRLVKLVEDLHCKVSTCFWKIAEDSSYSDREKVLYLEPLLVVISESYQSISLLWSDIDKLNKEHWKYRGNVTDEFYQILNLAYIAEIHANKRRCEECFVEIRDREYVREDDLIFRRIVSFSLVGILSFSVWYFYTFS